MFKKTITYEDFNGDTQTEDCYFNFSEAELAELEVTFGDQGLSAFINDVIATKDTKKTIILFKELILKAYGVKSEDGKKFKKSAELREDFASSAAYSALFMELSTNPDALTEFTNKIMPKKLIEEAKKQGLIDQNGNATTVSKIPSNTSN